MSNPTSTLAERVKWLSEFIERHPDLPAPNVEIWDHCDHLDLGWHTHSLTNSEQVEKARSVMRGIGGKWEKVPNGTDLYFKRKLIFDGIKVDFTIFATREAVCERRVVGTEEVTIPAVKAQPERVEVREIVEWDCAPVMADAKQVAS